MLEEGKWGGLLAGISGRAEESQSPAHLEGSTMAAPFFTPNPKAFGSTFALAAEEMTREASRAKNQYVE